MDSNIALPTRRLDAGTSLAQARHWQTAAVTLASPASEVMTDLTLVKAATTGPGTSLRQAEQIMIYQGVRMLFVVSDMPAIEGLITSTDLHGDRQMRVVQQRSLRYDELCVADVMTGLASLDAIDIADLGHASVANVIATLKRHGRNHLLVVDRAEPEAPLRVRGVISRAQVERQLGSAIELTEIADSFAELGRMLS